MINRYICELDGAIQGDNFEEILRIISLPDYDINRGGRCNWTALLFAVEHDKPELVKVFLQMGANPNTQRCADRYVTPLQLAVEKGNIDIARVLLQDPRTIDSVSGHSYHTSLHGAAIRGNRAMVDLLLEYGADPGFADLEGKTPSEYANHKGHHDLCIMLRKQAMSLLNLTIKTITTNASCARLFQDNERAKQIINESTSCYPLMGKESNNELFEAIATNNVPLVDQLLKSRIIFTDSLCANPDHTASYTACKNGSIEIVKMLVARGMELTSLNLDLGTKKWFTSIEIARKNKHHDIADYLESVKRREIGIFSQFMCNKLAEAPLRHKI